MTGGQPVREEPLTPGLGRNDWLSRLKVGRVARQVAHGITQELPSFAPTERAELVGGTWAVRLWLPPAIPIDTFVAAMAAENVPCAVDERTGNVVLPLDPSYLEEDVEHLVLGVAKVAHYLEQGRAASTSS